ncbi:MAG: hypothetical protein SXQ77_08700 [Halobacteria archaeon]|nr:hypothetical protein [Halobacteria archaeon]
MLYFYLTLYHEGSYNCFTYPSEVVALSYSPDSEDVEEVIEHNDYDPIGTAILLALYFVILVVMWILMYFVEFLGNGPTVIG